MIVQFINNNCGKRTTKTEADSRNYRTGLCGYCGWPLEEIEQRRIIAAAIYWNGIAFTGDRHGNIMQYLNKIGQLQGKPNGQITAEMQGFVDQDGIFMSRDEARVYAIFNKQVKPDHGILYSEDLW